ncbi:MAG: hypothetical protein AB1499_12030 [Nitrospirota bacterium]
MKNLHPLMLILLMTLYPHASYGHDPVWPGEKLKKLFPSAESFEQKNLFISDEQRKNIESALGSRLPEEDLQPSIYLAIVRSGTDGRLKKAAAIMFIDAYGKGGKIDMGIVVSGKSELMKILIFENREAESIRQPAFLDQFTGKKAGEPFKTGVDITSPEHEEKSAQAIASGVKRGLLIIHEIFKKK